MNEILTGKPPYIVGIAGGAGAGKSILAEKSASFFNREQVTVLSCDAYYKDQSHVPAKRRAELNFDHSEALDLQLLLEHLQQLRKGQRVLAPVYDFAAHCRKRQVVEINQPKVVILEGLFILADRQIRSFLDLRIFVDTDEDVRLVRRLQRDMSQRARSAESIISQYIATVRPMHKQFVEPSKTYADVVLQGGHSSLPVKPLVYILRGMLADIGSSSRQQYNLPETEDTTISS